MEYYKISEPLIMPDYGRNVQNMVGHALTIEDRDERQKCAETIIRTMSKLHPEFNNEEQQRIYYDHLAIMSGFRLDIAYPYGKPEQATMMLQPQKLPYSTGLTTHKYYGRVLMNIIAEATKETDNDKKKELIMRIAFRMRLSHYLWNKEQVDEVQVKNDITLLSNNQLDCNFPDFKTVFSWPLPTGKNKKKKK